MGVPRATLPRWSRSHNTACPTFIRDGMLNLRAENIKTWRRSGDEAWVYVHFAVLLIARVIYISGRSSTQPLYFTILRKEICVERNYGGRK